MSGHHHTHAGCADTREGPHDHHDHHDHAPRDFGRAFAIGTLLNLGFVGVEATSGVMANSMALLADAGHNLGDVLGLLIAWVANEAQKRAPTKRFTYGLTASPILASLANAMLLLIAVGAIAVEAIRQIISPAEVASLILRHGRPGDIVVYLGAGSSTEWAHALPVELAEEPRRVGGMR